MTPEDMPQGLREIIEQSMMEEKCNSAIEQRLEPLNGKAEEEILMKLYSELGDSQHGYYLIMQCIGEMIRVLKESRKMKSMPSDVHIKILTTLSQLFMVEVDCLKIVKEEMEKHGLEE